MILKLIVEKEKKGKKNKIIVWIQKGAEFEDDVQQLFNFFKTIIKITTKRRRKQYYKVSSENPAIMMSLFSRLQEIIPEIYIWANETGSDTLEDPEYLVKIRNRNCWKCGEILSYVSFSQNALRISIKDPERVWNHPNIEILCCNCLKII